MKKYIFLAIALLAIIHGHTQPTPIGTLTVCGRWHGYQASDASQERNTKPAILVYEKHLKADLNNYQTAFDMTIRQDSFYLSIPLTKPLQHIRMEGITVNETTRLLTGQLLLVRPGDSLHLTLRQDTLPLVGGNNPTLDLQFRLAEISAQPLSLGTDKGFDFQIQHGLAEIRERLAAADALDGRASERANPYMHALCLENFRYTLLSKLCQRLYANTVSAKREIFHPQLADKLATAFAPFFRISDERMVTASSTYLTFQFFYHTARGALTARLEGFSPEDNWQIANHAYHHILLLPDPMLKDQVLLQFFGASRDFRRLSREGLPLLEDALRHVRDPEVYAQLQSLRNNLAGGGQVPDFDFFDRRGNPVGFGDFPGKVVLAHFWFKGCTACVELSSGLHPLVEHYRDHPDVVFLNINVDRVPERWLAGLGEGKYHNDHEITLNTGHEGMGHPLLRHYGFKGFPQVVLADQQGKLVSLRTYSKDDESETEILERLIADLLN